MKKIVGNLLVAAVTLGLTVLALELILRTTHVFNARVAWSQPDDLIAYRHVPGAAYWNRQEGGRSSGRINRFGWRDVEWSLEKPPGVFRVAVVGDSYVEGFEVELGETFAKIAEQILTGRGRGVEVMSFGRSGFTTTEELLVIEREVLRFGVDLVALFFFPYNDIRDVTRELSPDALRPFYVEDGRGGLMLDTSFQKLRGFKARRLIDPLKRRSALVSLVAERYNAASRAAAREGREGRHLKPTGYLSLCTAAPDPRYVEAFSLNRRLIRDAARFVGPERLLVVTMESPGWKREEETLLKAQDPTFDAFCFEKSLGDLARAEGMRHLGLQTAFRRDWQSRRRPLHWSHWNYDGHRLVGSVLAEAVEAAIAERAGPGE